MFLRKLFSLLSCVHLSRAALRRSIILRSVAINHTKKFITFTKEQSARCCDEDDDDDAAKVCKAAEQCEFRHENEF